jgi:hypothetical protein
MTATAAGTAPTVLTVIRDSMFTHRRCFRFTEPTGFFIVEALLRPSEGVTDAVEGAQDRAVGRSLDGAI